MTEQVAICPDGHESASGSAYCARCGKPIGQSDASGLSTQAPIGNTGMATPPMPPMPPPTAASPQAGWHPDPHGVSAQRWWDGRQWTDHTAPHPQPAYQAPAYVVPGSAEKSSGLAILFTILWPGAGHLYLGFSKKGTPFVVANAIGVVISLTVILLPIGLLIWVVTLCMTVGSVNADAEIANQAAREGRRLVEQ